MRGPVRQTGYGMADGDANVARVLIIDASPDDAERALATLRQDGHSLKTTQRITDAANLKSAALEDWDLVLCESNVRDLALDQILGLARARHPHTPFIVLARQIDDDALKQAMQAGVSDVVVKGHWARFACVVRRALEIAARQEQHRKTAEALQQLETRYRLLVQHAREPIGYCHDGLHIDANPAYLALFGYTDVEELKVVPVLNLVAKREKERLKALLRRPAAGNAEEFTAVTQDGKEIPIEIALLPIEIGGEQCVQVKVTDLSDRKSLELKLRQMRQRDALTGLFNRHYFAQELGRLGEAARGGAVIGVELLGLREMNACLGHAACDRLLLMLARELRTQFGEDDIPARVGGGQFAVLLPGRAASDAEALAKRLDQHLKGLRFNEGGQTLKYDYTVTCTGIDVATDRQKLLGLLFPSAEPMTTASAAANSAPASKPAAVAPAPAAPTTEPVATPPSAIIPAAPAAAPAAAADTAWEATIRTALQRDALQLWYQPVMNMYGEPRDFHELLLHVNSDGAIIPATAFLRGAPHPELATKVDRWQLQHTIAHLAKLMRQGRHATFFVRLSTHAVHDPLLLAAAQQHAKTVGVPAAHIFLQLSAPLLVRSAQATSVFIAQAKAAGFGVALTDFDARSTRAPVFTDIAVDFARIDYPALLAAEGGDAGIRDAVATAKGAGISTIATGVDSAEAFALLWDCGVDYVQGDYLHPASSELNYAFEGEQTLASDRVPSGWQVTA